MKLVMFSKHLQELSVLEAGRRAKALGFDGLDLTVRPGGHIPPEQVRQELPKAVTGLAEAGVGVPMITTSLTSAGDPHAEATLETAAKAGIRELKLGYWRYRPFGRLREQLDAARKDLDGLEALARKHGVRVSVHTHSADYLSAVPAHVAGLLRGRDPHHVGAYIDPGHMTLEGFASGWMQGVDELQDWISLVAVKSLGFFPEKEAATGETRWRDRIVPLKEGIVRWREVFRCLRQLGWDGIVSFHSEYQGAHSFRDMTTDQVIAQTREDLAYLRPILRQAGYLTVAVNSPAR